MSLFIRLHTQSESHSVSIPQYFLKTVIHDTSSTMELDSNNCVVGLMVLVKS